MSNDCLCFKNYQCLSCERAVTIKQRKPINQGVPRKIAQCGTRAGYNRHLKQGEPTCAKCKAAQTEAVKKHKREKANG